MGEFIAEFYENGDKIPVKDFLDSLNVKMRAKLLMEIKLLEEKANNMRYDDYLQEQLKNPDIKKEWDDLQPEMDVIRAMIDARIKNNLTQKELAARTGIDQADISKLENGTRNPSLKLLKRLAHGMGMQLKIEFVPMQPLKK